MLAPYYDEDGITIYNADCREVLPLLPKVDLVLTDPPYGIGRDGMRASTSSHGGRKAYEFKGWDSSTPSAETFQLMFNAGREQIIWGGNYFTQHLPPSMGWLVWDKGQRICSSDAELAFTSYQKALRVFTLNRVALATDGAQHPTQKPLALMMWCLSQARGCRSVLDPFMGSGTTLVAAKQMGLRAIGVDAVREYCDIAIDRLRQQMLFPVEQEAAPEQLQLA